MCGIAGFNGTPHAAGLDAARKMLSRISHRGPDGQGIAGAGSWHIGHVRLAIIDIAGGSQPMRTPDNRYTIALNGEIYNYRELRALLEKKGRRFTTRSDTEVLLHLLAEFKGKALDMVNGMFAFAFHDAKDDSLLLARDHFGIKPLYYHSHKGRFVFCSEIKGLLAHPGVTATVDRQALGEYATLQMVLGEDTLFKGIKKLEPASCMVIKQGCPQPTRKYWKLDYRIDDSRSEGSYSRELEKLLSDSVRMQTRSDVPLGAYLSGGVDSGIVTTLAARHYPAAMHAFTGGFKDPGQYDESAYAAVVSRDSGCRHHLIYPTAKDFAKYFHQVVYHMDEPAAGPSVFSQFMVCRKAREHVKVVLGGQGGDEVFGGYARYLVAYLEQCLKGAIFETQNRRSHIVTMQSIIPNLSMLKQYVPLIKQQFSSGMFEPMDARYFRMVDRGEHLAALYTADFVRGIRRDEIFGRFCAIFNSPQTRSYLNKMTHYDLQTLLPALLQVEDRVSMASSIESRVPLLDTRIVELAAHMPPMVKFKGGKPKYILLKAGKGFLPQEVLQRKDKMGFPTPFNAWLKGPLKGYALDILTSRAAASRGIIDPKKVRSQMDSAGDFNRHLWGALNLEMWFRTFID